MTFNYADSDLIISRHQEWPDSLLLSMILIHQDLLSLMFFTLMGNINTNGLLKYMLSISLSLQ